MSVTFAPVTTSFPQTWGVTCLESDQFIYAEVNTYEGALQVRASHMATCDDCNTYGCFTGTRVVGIEVPEVNLGQRNAFDVLSTLGLQSDDLCGSMDPEAFQSILLAHADADLSLATVRTGNHIDCGRPTGYLQSTLSRLAEVAQFAAEYGVEVQWA